jgi:hypothetical protein
MSYPTRDQNEPKDGILVRSAEALYNIYLERMNGKKPPGVMDDINLTPSAHYPNHE